MREELARGPSCEVAVPVVEGEAPPEPTMPDNEHFAQRRMHYGIELVGPRPRCNAVVGRPSRSVPLPSRTRRDPGPCGRNAAGYPRYRVHRYTWQQITEHPELVASDLRVVLAKPAGAM